MTPREEPDPLALALDGDEEALEFVLGGICAPVFDLALHLRGPRDAADAAAGALAELARLLRRGGPLPAEDPVAIPARALLEPGDGLPPPGGALAAVPPRERRALLAACAADLEGEALAHALGVAPSDARSLVENALRSAGGEDRVREELDRVAGASPLPPGLVDRALAESGGEPEAPPSAP